MVEIIIMTGVLGNFFLQLGWFLWSYNLHQRKHIDDDYEEIDLVDKIDEFYSDKIRNEQMIKTREKRWQEWEELRVQDIPVESAEIIRDSNIEKKIVLPKLYDDAVNWPDKIEPNPEAKYNPDEIPGEFDSLFGIAPEQTKQTK